MLTEQWRGIAEEFVLVCARAEAAIPRDSDGRPIMFVFTDSDGKARVSDDVVKAYELAAHAVRVVAGTYVAEAVGRFFRGKSL